MINCNYYKQVSCQDYTESLLVFYHWLTLCEEVTAEAM